MPGEPLALLELIPCKATYTELANKLLNLLNEKLGSPFIITKRILVCLPYFYLEPAADKTEKALLILNKLRADYYLNCNCQVEGKFLIDSINIEAIFIIERTKDTINYLVKKNFICCFFQSNQQIKY